jgi:hypothetical protein
LLTINLLSPEDELLRGRIVNQTEKLAKAAYKTIWGINILVPEQHRAGLSMRPEQTTYHYDARPAESIATLWNILDDLHKLWCRSHHITNPQVCKEVQEDIMILTIGLLKLLHWA